jgi:hypothetical protein
MLSIERVWFSSDINLDTDADVSFYYELPPEAIKSHANLSNATRFKTLITDLSAEEDVLWKGIKKNYRNEIRRSENDKSVVTEIIDSNDDVPSDLMDIFEESYNLMYQYKGIDVILNKNQLVAYMEERAISFSVAYIDSEPMVFHVYITDGHTARLLYSVSRFRDHSDVSAKIAMANKRLHWTEMRHYRAKGVSTLDWGGYVDEEQPISAFKKRFGGEVKDTYHLTIGNTILGKIGVRFFLRT